jgi:peptidoglycan/LPS O-acetylase OafA/YrhL
VALPQRSRRLGYQPALDGLRGIAVVAVLLYHGGVSWARGGFLGVDLFFVLSGFLITWLLLSEHGTTGRISIRAFYARRARRLFPALALVLIVVAAYAVGLAPRSQLEQLQGDLLAALGYATNWRLIGQDRGYFDAFAAPSPLQHTWSVAVEEQWYLLWPPVMTGLLAVARRLRTHWLLGAATGVLCVASWVLTMVLAAPDIDPSRVYYGTDTRAHQLLLGALLAIVRQPLGVQLSRRWRGRVTVLGTAGLLWILWLATTVEDDGSSWLFDGGLGLVALASCAGILAAVQPDGWLVRALSSRPLGAVGMISYGLYLWHYPVFVVLSATRTNAHGTALLLLRLAATTAVAIASYWLVERPIRNRTIAISRPSLALGGGLAVAIGATLLMPAPPPSRAPAALVEAQASLERPDDVEPGAATSSEDEAASAPASRPPSGKTFSSGGSPGLRYGLVAPTLDPSDRVPRVLLTGDSVALTLQAETVERIADPAALIWNLGSIGCPLFDADRTFRDERTDGGWWCRPWRADRPRWIREFDPDVVLVLSGVWETYDRIVGEQELAVGDPEHDRWFATELDSLIDLLGSGGADVVLVTMPCNQRAEGVGAEQLPENQKERVDHINDLYRRTAERRGDTTLVDLHELVCPSGKYLPTLDGRDLRYDGVHFTPEGAELVRAWILEQVLERRTPRPDR